MPDRQISLKVTFHQDEKGWWADAIIQLPNGITNNYRYLDEGETFATAHEAYPFFLSRVLTKLQTLEPVSKPDICPLCQH